ncbi:putative hemin transport protein [Marinospirillum celere]|uniref:Putative hemin transport protein n=1 Tax=Marinospirillum celere TaxID=1122252 RepID=A0A1I1FSJ5_9GAMM|nr:ChuX/HutX family heme-like substrate-binding protein [Marinospirillum celere]SFC02002.1 putative hemin transport protein [Marinospirillum celere]
MTAVKDTSETSSLFQALCEFRDRKQPGFMVDWAKQLNTSEGALQACRIGQEKVWAIQDIRKVLKFLPKLGRVLALTRNAGVVHEYKGCYPEPKLGEQGRHASGIFLDIGGLDLRLFMDHWYWGCAFEEETSKGKKRSLQFFDHYGQAVHKVFALEESNISAWEELLSDLAAEDPSPLPEFVPQPLASNPAPVSPQQLAEEWRQMTDVHQFFSLIRRHRTTRFAALQAVPSDLSRPVKSGALERVVEQAATSGMEVMFFVGSRGCVQIYTGKVSGFKPMRGWLNLFEPNFTLHADPSTFAHAFVTRKPQSGGWVTSLEIFDSEGRILLQMYGRRDEGEPEQQAWTELLASLPDA